MPWLEYRAPDASTASESTTPLQADGNAWFPARSPVGSSLRVAAMRAAFHFCVEDAAGPIRYGGKALRLTLPAEDAKASSLTQVFYFVPKTAWTAPVVVDTSRAVALTVCVNCCRNELTPGRADHRLTLLEAAVRANAAADVFVAAEDFLCEWVRPPALEPADSASASTTACNIVPGRYGPAMAMVERLRILSGAHPAMLIVPGTMVFYSSSGTEVYNRAYVLLGGQLVSSIDGRSWYDKNDVSPERDMNLPFKSGPFPFFDFRFRDLRCRLQICADSSMAPPPPEPVDLQIVIAHLPGASSTFTHLNGCKLLADGASGSALMTQGRTPVQAAEPKGECEVFNITTRVSAFSVPQVAAALPADVGMPAALAALIASYT